MFLYLTREGKGEYESNGFPALYTIFHFFLSKWINPLQDEHLSKADNIFETVSIRFREVPLYKNFSNFDFDFKNITE